MASPIVDSSEDEDGTPTPPPSRAHRKSRDDVSGNQTFPDRTRGHRQPSTKQAATDKENIDAMKRKLDKAQKDLDRAKRKLGKQSKAAAQPTLADDGLESEEPQSEPEGAAITFQSSSIIPLAPLPREPPRPTAIVKKTKQKAHAPPKTSSRAFVTLPDNPIIRNASDDSDSDVPTSSTAHPSSEGPRSSDMDVDAPDPGSERDSHTHGSTPPATSRKRPNQDPAPPPEAPKRQRREPQFADEYKAVKGAKPKASDYESVVQALLIRAMLEYTARIVTINAFPDVGLQTTWAKECFKNACRTTNEHFKINARMILLRCPGSLRYDFNRTSTLLAAIKFNRDLSDKLNDGAAFHYKIVDDLLSHCFIHPWCST
ncbi:hypothetical protein B0H14DRAFT_3440202 [Mycena olivaceomarginata]|nr:hypothetical protein B0H14DRAFT_3440202 [Mycena olivaceomarginata]